MRISRRDTIDRYYVFQWHGWGIFLHRIKQSDPIEVMHTHPWSWVSFIFGSYIEDRPGIRGKIKRFVNFCSAGQPHRVTIQKPLWTILIHGPRKCQWTVTDDDGNILEVQPWTGTDNPDRTNYIK